MTTPTSRASRVVRDLAAAGLTVAVAESLTGGLLGATLTAVPGSSAVLRGGLIVYATDLKASLAGVDAALLAANGPVDPEVARQLASGAARRCGADLGVGLTGVAGPGPADGDRQGTFHVALAVRDGHTDRHTLISTVAAGDREAVRAAAMAAALTLIEEHLQAREHAGPMVRFTHETASPSDGAPDNP